MEIETSSSEFEVQPQQGRQARREGHQSSSSEFEVQPRPRWSFVQLAAKVSVRPFLLEFVERCAADVPVRLIWRPGNVIHIPWLDNAPAPIRCLHFHRGQGPVSRRHLRRTALAIPEPRMPLLARFGDRIRVRAGVRKWMGFQNRKRPHSAIGEKTRATVYWLRNEPINPDQQEPGVAETATAAVQPLGSSSIRRNAKNLEYDLCQFDADGGNLSRGCPPLQLVL